MKVYLNGASHWSSQNPRIAQGFRDLGHEVTEFVNDADLIYSNDSHRQLLLDQRRGDLKPGVKVILTVLDIPEHLFPRFDLSGLAKEILAADALCTISEFGRQQVRRYLDRDSHVIFQPIMNVALDSTVKISPFYRFAHVGRRSDVNKRFHLAAQALQILGYEPRDLCLVGNESGWGDYLGVQSEPNLNRVLNSVDFVLCTSEVEGLCLPVLEAMACGAIPVVCRGMTTRKELLPPDLFPEYETVEFTPESVARFIARFTNDEYGANMEEFKRRLWTHYTTNWRDRVSGRGVAAAILKVYERIA